MKLLGFDNVAEVAVGADCCTMKAKDFLPKVPGHQPFAIFNCRVEHVEKSSPPILRPNIFHG